MIEYIQRICFAAALVLWDYDATNGARYRDALECAEVITGPWSEVPGPYHLSKDGKTYIVRVETLRPQKFFRVARTWGTPLLMPIKKP